MAKRSDERPTYVVDVYLPGAGLTTMVETTPSLRRAAQIFQQEVQRCFRLAADPAAPSITLGRAIGRGHCRVLAAKYAKSTRAEFLPDYYSELQA